MKSVQSSNISKVGYDNNNLIVQFHNGGLYRYYNVPYCVYNDLMNAPSKGQYLHYNVKGIYEYSKLNY